MPSSVQPNTDVARKPPSLSQFYTSSIDTAPSARIQISYQQQLKEAKEIGQLSWPEGSKYRIIDALAVGGMGAILRARDREAGRDVAMKVMLRADVESPAAKRFIREARIVGTLEHPNIVPVHDIGTSPLGEPYFTMKWVRGETLADILYKIRRQEAAYLAQYTLPALLTIFMKLCDGIAFAHSRHVVHLDIKPHNVLVGDYGEVLVLDWGLAALLSHKDDEIRISFVDSDGYEERTVASTGKFDYGVFTEDGTVKGTPGFMAPEQANGAIAEVDERADIYSLGSVLYMILTLKFPIVGENPAEILRHTIAGNFVPPGRRTKNQHVPHSLERMVMKAMQRDKTMRYASVSELREDVAAFLVGRITSVEQDRLWSKIGLFARRHRHALLATAGGLVVVLLLLGVFVSRLQFEAETARKERERSDRFLQTALAAKTQAQSTQVLATTERREAKLAQQSADRHAYLANLRLSELSLRDRRYDMAKQALAQCPESLRHWEWGRLRYLADLQRASILTQMPQHHIDMNTATQMLAYSHSGNEIVLSDYATNRLVKTIPTAGGSLITFALSPNGDRLLVCTTSEAMQVSHLATATKSRLLTNFPYAITKAEFLRHGDAVVVGTDNGMLAIVDVTADGRVQMLKAHEQAITALRVDPEQNRLISGSEDGTAKVWDTSSGRLLFEVKGHAAAVTSVAGSSTIGRFVTGSRDQFVISWDARTGQQLVVIPAQQGAIHAVDVSESANTIVSAGADGTVKLWHADSGAPQGTLQGHEGPINTVAIDLDGQTVISAGDDGRIAVWNTQSMEPFRRFVETPTPCNGAIISPNRRFVAIGGADGVARLWDFDSAEPLHGFTGHRGSIADLCVSADSQRLVTVGVDQTMIIWNVRKGRERSILRGHTGGINAVAISGDGRKIASGSDDGTVRIWNGISGLLLFTLPDHGQPVRGVAFSRDGKHVISAGDDKAVRLWLVEDGAPQKTFSSFAAAVTAVSLTDDGSAFLAADANGNLSSWSIAKNSCQWSVVGHRGKINRMIVTEDDRRVITCGDDMLVKIWDRASGTELAILKGHTAAIRAICLDSESRTLLSCGDDRQAILWDAASW